MSKIHDTVSVSISPNQFSCIGNSLGFKWQIPPCFPPLTYISMAEDFVLVEAAVLVLLPDDVVLPKGKERRPI